MRETLLLLALVAPSHLRGAEAPLTFHGKTFEQWHAELKHKDAKVRGRAAMALGLGPFGKESTPILLKALGDKNGHVRRCVLAALGESGPRANAAIPVLAALLSLEKEDHVALYCALGRIGPEAGDAILAAFAENRRHEKEASRALRVIGPAALPALVKALTHEKVEVRRFALTEIDSLGREAAPAVPALLALLEKESGLECRTFAFSSLCKIGPKAKSAIPLLIKRLHDENQRDEAARALIGIGEAAFPALRQAIDKGSPAVRLAILKSLRPGWNGALPFLLASLRERDPTIRDAAAATLNEFSLDLGEHLQRLREGLRDPSSAVRSGIYLTLARIRPQTEETARLLALGILDPSGDFVEDVKSAYFFHLGEVRDAGVAVFLRALKHRREHVRETAARLLIFADPANRAMVLGLCEALRDNEVSVRIAAAQTIGHLGPSLRRIQLANETTFVEVVVPALQSRLREGDARVRICTAYALCRVGYPTDAAFLQIARILADPFADTRDLPIINSSYDAPLDPQWEAVRTLQQFGGRGRAAVPLLIKELENQDSLYHYSMAEALGHIGPAANAAVPALARTLTRSDAFSTLAELGTEALKVLPAVRALTKESSYDVRRTAFDLLDSLVERKVTR